MTSVTEFCPGHDGMVVVERVMHELVTHSCNHPPGNVGLLVSLVGVDVRDGPTDLDQLLPFAPPSPAHGRSDIAGEGCRGWRNSRLKDAHE